MTRLRSALGGLALGVVVGALTGLAEATFRALHPSMVFRRSTLLVNVVLYAVVWSLAGLVIGVLLPPPSGRSVHRRPLAMLCGLSLLVVVGGHVNIHYLPAAADPYSLLFDLVALLVATGAVIGLLRWLPDWDDRGVFLSAGLLLLTALIISIVSAFGPGAPSGSPGRTAREVRTRGDSPDILIVLFDALRADHTSVSGYARPTTPTLEEIAREGVVFLTAYAQSSWTKPSVATLFTGVYPATHRVTALSARLPNGLTTLPMLLKAQGYRTGVFSQNGFVSPLFGYDRGVDRFVYDHGWNVALGTVLGHVLGQVGQRLRPLAFLRPLMQRLDVLDPTLASGWASIADLPHALLNWIDERPDQPYFAYVHFLAPHRPYVSPAPFDGRFGAPSKGRPASAVEPPYVPGVAPFVVPEPWSAERTAALIAAYDEKLLYGDSLLARIVSGLLQRRRLQETAIIVIGDHGEEFGEHGVWEHGYSLYEAVTRVPFLLYAPTRVHAPARVTTPVRLLDVAPTVLDLAGLAAEPQFEGRSVLAILQGKEEQPRPVLTQLEYGMQLWSNALVRDGLKLINTRSGRNTASQLFDLRQDPNEEHDLATLNPDGLTTMENELQTMLAAAGRKRQDAVQVIMDPGLVERLKALGYEQE